MKKKKTLDIASILMATLTIVAKALKPSSRGTKYVRGKLECLSKDLTEKSGEEMASKVETMRKIGNKEKGKVTKETHKKKKPIHNSGSPS